MPVRSFVSVCVPMCVCVFASVADAQVPPPMRPPQASAARAAVERLGPDRYRIGTMDVDTAKREVTLRGSVNQVTVLEFVANAKGGMKAYETALTLDTDAINFNVALVLIGLDKSHGKPSKQHFDPNPVAGDPVEITFEWTQNGRVQRAPIEKLLYDRTAKEELPPGDWVYTGSVFTPEGRYMAEIEGTLIGFAHTPSSVIESVKGVGLSRYGSIVLNPSLGLVPTTPVTVYIRALTAPPAPSRRPVAR